MKFSQNEHFDILSNAPLKPHNVLNLISSHASEIFNAIKNILSFAVAHHVNILQNIAKDKRTR